MKVICIAIIFVSFVSCYEEKPQKIRESDIRFVDSIAQIEAHLGCVKFERNNTAEEYFQSANNRLKDGCPNSKFLNLIALKEFEFAIKLQPNFYQARKNYASQLFNLKRYKECADQCNIAIKYAGSGSLVSLKELRGMAHYELGAYENAIDDFDYAIGRLSNPDYVLFRKAKAVWKMGDEKYACELYHQAVLHWDALKQHKEFISCD